MILNINCGRNLNWKRIMNLYMIKIRCPLVWQHCILLIVSKHVVFFGMTLFKKLQGIWNHYHPLKNQWKTSGFATTHVVVSVRQPITYWSPNLPNTLKFILEIIKLTARVECGASIHAIFQLTVRRIRMFFSLKPLQSQGKSSLKISGRWDSPFRRS